MGDRRAVLVPAGALFLAAWIVVIIGSGLQGAGQLLLAAPGAYLWYLASEQGTAMSAERKAQREQRDTERAEILAQLEARDGERTAEHHGRMSAAAARITE